MNEKYANIITQAVEETLDYVITDESNEPILAAYHAVSSGKTESAEVVWGKNYPYLQAVESIGDLLSPDYLSVRNFTVSDASILSSSSSTGVSCLVSTVWIAHFMN